MELTASPTPTGPNRKSRARRLCPGGDGGRRLLGPAALVLALALSACAQMPLKEGPRARLMAGIAEPRDRHNMDITIYKVPVTAWPKCLEMVAEKNPVLAVASALTLSVIHACAHVPRDKALKVGQRPWCVVAVPEGDEETLEHELRHCEGWDHPKSTAAAYANRDLNLRYGSAGALSMTENEPQH